MVHVIASVRVRPGRRADYLEILATVAPVVRQEQGCIEYLPAIDLDLRLPPQILDDSSVLILEKWESPEALRAHLVSRHMLDYRERVKDIVEQVTVRVLREATGSLPAGS